EEDHLPVAELVAGRLDHQRPVRRQAARARDLVADVATQVAGGGGVEEVVAPEPSERVLPVEAAGQFAQEAAHGEAQVVAAPALLAPPEGGHGRGPLGGTHEDAVGLDLLEAPGGGAEQERVADAALVDELLVQ